MSDSKVVFIPSMSLTYEDNMLEFVGIGGELYRRDTPLIAENSVLKAENAKLRKLLRQSFACIRQGEDEYGSDWSCAGCEFCDTCDGLIQMRATAQELGVIAE